jgi:hypothetical protein
MLAALAVDETALLAQGHWMLIGFSVLVCTPQCSFLAEHTDRRAAVEH